MVGPAAGRCHFTHYGGDRGTFSALFCMGPRYVAFKGSAAGNRGATIDQLP